MADEQPPKSIPEHCATIAHALTHLERRLGDSLDFVSCTMSDLSSLLTEQAERVERFKRDPRINVEEICREHERIQATTAQIPSQAIENLFRMQAKYREIKALNAATIQIGQEESDAQR